MTDSPPPPPAENVGSEREEQQPATRVFPCDGCGADFEFSIDAQSLKCPFCGHTRDLEIAEGARIDEQDLRATLDRLTKVRQEGMGPTGDLKEVDCRDCGAKVQFHGTLTSKECPYCGTPIQLAGVHDAVDGVPVDGVLPFMVERRQAQENLKSWVGSRWFAPNEFKRRGVEGHFNGVYMPYWTYDAMTILEHNQIGEGLHSVLVRSSEYWVHYGPSVTPSYLNEYGEHWAVYSNYTHSIKSHYAHNQGYSEEKSIVDFTIYDSVPPVQWFRNLIATNIVNAVTGLLGMPDVREAELGLSQDVLKDIPDKSFTGPF